MAHYSRVQVVQGIRNGTSFDRTDLLPPSIDPDELAAIGEVPVPGLPEDRLIVSCVGRMHAGKRMDLLIRAFAEAGVSKAWWASYLRRTRLRR